MARLTVGIAARNEQFLLPTVLDVLKNRRLDTEIIVVLDGQWPVEPLPDHPDVHLVYHPQSIGQRAAINETVRLSRAEFVMKLDAHCSVDEGFDAKLLAPYDSGELDRTVTSIPAQHRLHVYNRVCKACGDVQGQGPMDVICMNCSAPNSYEIQMVWKPRKTPSTKWVLDSTLHFAYDKKDRCRLNRGIHDVMTSLGACWVMKRDRWNELGGLDESIGSWGQVGASVATKSWLSGGRHVCNTTTWFSHFFRVGGIGMPYEIHGRDQELARKRYRKIWLNNAWPGQKLPLSWLIDKFWPIHPSTDAKWSDDARNLITKAGEAFTSARKDAIAISCSPRFVPSQQDVASAPVLLTLLGGVADLTVAFPIGPGSPEQVPSDAVGLPSFSSGRTVTAQDVLGDSDESEMQRIDAMTHVAEVVNRLSPAVRPAVERFSAEPREHDGVDTALGTLGAASGESDSSVSGAIEVARPQPASGVVVDLDLLEDAPKLLAVQVGNAENALSHDSASYAESRLGAPACENHVGASLIIRPTVGVLYITHNVLDQHIFDACLRQLKRAVNGHRVVSVSHKPVDLGQNILFTPTASPHLNYFRQLALGVEALDVDVVYIAEHDCLMPREHFYLVPSDADAAYYDQAVWRVNATTGMAITHAMMSVSGLCANRNLLLDHYRKMVARVEKRGYWYKWGHEPGIFPGRVDPVSNVPAVGWRSAKPYVDIRHGSNLTGSRWSPDKFEVPPANWQESDGVPGWGRTLGRFDAWLEEVTR